MKARDIAWIWTLFICAQSTLISFHTEAFVKTEVDCTVVARRLRNIVVVPPLAASLSSVFASCCVCSIDRSVSQWNRESPIQRRRAPMLLCVGARAAPLSYRVLLSHWNRRWSNRLSFFLWFQRHQHHVRGKLPLDNMHIAQLQHVLGASKWFKKMIKYKFM